MNKKIEEELLKKYAEKTGKAIKDLKPLLEKAKTEAEEMGYPEKETIIKGLLRKKVNSMIYLERTGKITQRKEPVVFRGFLLGADTIRDTKDSMRRTALREYDEDPEEAKLAGFVDEQGTPLDTRTTVKNRRGEEVDNPEYHKPIIGHKYVRDIYGIVTTIVKKEPKLFKMTLWEGFASSFTYRPFTPVEFKCTIKTDGDYYLLNAPRPPKGEKAFKSTTMEIDYKDWIEKVSVDRKYALDNLDEAVKATAKAIDPWIFVEGVVDYINSEVNPKMGTRSITLVDVDSGMTETVWISIPKDFPLAFREYSKVKVFGKPRKWKRAEDEDYSYSLNGISIYPIPGEVIESKVEIARAANGEEEQEEGWNLWED